MFLYYLTSVKHSQTNDQPKPLSTCTHELEAAKQRLWAALSEKHGQQLLPVTPSTPEFPLQRPPPGFLPCLPPPDGFSGEEGGRSARPAEEGGARPDTSPPGGAGQGGRAALQIALQSAPSS